MMDIERFRALADAYGADLRRWPESERAAAAALIEAEPGQTRAVMAEADELDALLHASPPPQPSQALRDAILAAAPRARAQRRGFGFWLSGAGLAAAGMAGLLIGASASSAMVEDVRADAALAEAMTAEPLDALPLDLSRVAVEDLA